MKNFQTTRRSFLERILFRAKTLVRMMFLHRTVASSLLMLHNQKSEGAPTGSRINQLPTLCRILETSNSFKAHLMLSQGQTWLLTFRCIIPSTWRVLTKWIMTSQTTIGLNISKLWMSHPYQSRGSSQNQDSTPLTRLSKYLVEPKMLEGYSFRINSRPRAKL